VPEDADVTRWEQPSAAAGGSPLDEEQGRSDSAPLQETVPDRSGDAAPEDRLTSSGSPAGRGKTFGEYELVDEIARGGMGVVYRARQTKLNRIVALKMILAGELASSSDVQRFYTEAEAAASLRHPGIVPIFDIGEVAGQHYFSMGYIDGTSLAAAVREGPVPARDAARFCEQIADAIAYAHQQGIIHRDLKPGNVLLDGGGQPHVTDFGLAKIVQGDSDLTGTGQVVGTPSYMPPEQASGKSHDVGPTSDVYSLGAILYFLLTARPPFQASNLMETLKQVMEQEPVSPRQLNPGVPPDLETICLKCLEKPQSRRYASARELANELRRFLNDEPILARPVTAPARAWRWCRRNPGISGLLLAIAGSLLCGVGFSTYFAIQADVQLKQAQKNERRATQAQAEAQSAAEKAAASAVQAGRERDAAEEAKKKAESLRELARRQVEEAAPRAYLGDMRRAQLDWPRLSTVQRLDILRAHDPSRAVSSSQTDPRGWEWYYLRGLCEANEHTLRGHTSYVDLVEWSPDGTRLASASSDKGQKEDTIRIWNAQTGRLYRPLRGHKAPATAIAWHPAGNRLATGHENGDVMIWDITSGTALETLDRGKVPIPALCYSPAGDWLAAAAGDLVCVWDAAKGEFRKALTGHAREVRRMKWNASGKLLATGALFDAVRIWDVASGTPVRVIEHSASWADDAWSPAIAWHADGKRFACETARTRVTVFDLEDPAARPKVCVKHTMGANDLQFSPDGRFLAAFGPERVNVWDWRAGAEPVAARAGAIGGWIANSARLLLAAPQTLGRIEVFDVAEARTVGVLEGHLADMYALRPAPNGGRFASAGADRTVRLWTLNTLARLGRLETPRGAKMLFGELSPDGRALAAYSWDRGEILVFDSLTGKRSRSLALSGSDPPVESLAWSPDGAILASCGLLPGDQKKGRLTLWDVKSGTQIRSIGAGAALRNPRFSPDGSKLAAWNPAPDSSDDASPDPKSDRATLRWIRASVAKCPPSKDFAKSTVVHFKNQSSGVVQLVWVDFSGNRQPNYGSLEPGEERKQGTGAGHAWLIADAAGNELGHFIAGDREAQAVITGVGPETDIFSVSSGARLSRLYSDAGDWAWSPDGAQIVTTNDIVWETAGGKQVGKAGLQCESPLEWSPDGKRLAGARLDQTLQVSRLCLWNLETKTLTVSSPIRSRLGRIRFSPDSSRVLTVTPDEVSVWDPSAPEMAALTFPESDAVLKLSASEPIIDARWSANGKSICWATISAVQTRDAAPGYQHNDAPAGGGIFRGTNAELGISARPAAAAATLVFRPDSFVREWHFSPRSKPWVDRDQFVKIESGELDRLQAAALAAPAVVSTTAYIDVLPHLSPGHHYVAGYAVRRFTSDSRQTLRLYAGSDDAARIWLNRELVLEAFALRSAQPDQETADVQLRAGPNTLVVEISNGLSDCGFYLRLEHTDGTPAVIDSEGRISAHPDSSMNH
jgi:WD40 repeat protein/tRNA A-37 threonylcarbamoyl transferase component Bud32